MTRRKLTFLAVLILLVGVVAIPPVSAAGPEQALVTMCETQGGVVTSDDGDIRCDFSPFLDIAKGRGLQQFFNVCWRPLDGTAAFAIYTWPGGVVRLVSWSCDY